MSHELNDKYKAFLSSLYDTLKEEELLEAEQAEEVENRVFTKAFAKPDLSIQFPDKNKLKKIEQHKIYALRKYAPQAMSLAATLVLGLIMHTQAPQGGTASKYNNTDDKLLPSFPVMQQPLSPIVSSGFEASPAFTHIKNLTLSDKTQSNQSSLTAGEIAAGRKELDNVMKLLRNRTQEYSTASIAAPSTDEYISALVFRNRQGFGQAETKIFLDNPLAKPLAQIGDREIPSRHTLTNLNKDNMYSLRVSLARW